ncbi:hypothetical protein ACWT_3148 [Actinoplanes sp. SE50]|uniref:hypothetical protein n=1 Tax=unclassified Actinoplanes TaxID=2626549 RepID=UPI00023EC5FA|nr:MULTISPECIES: hypothetical protein [unclassified Actinoplanes]AEV84171.1 hypothetical protein ACPL_3276 [Actinoplanes sp. SE50/110]ATO82563.1 hypothetical protein ACWT_3148 [Actinoplanes sp. SE50]SLL99970.1 hypothetical protein ACSP50_3202 [Actinoplanes sp. SE50/110]
MSSSQDDDRELRRRCQAVVDALEIPYPFDMALLCQRIGGHRGRPIHLIAMPMPPGGPSGVWISARDYDAIFYEADTGRPHQDHIIGHELGHLLCGHERGVGDDLARMLLPDLDPALVRRVLQRTGYSAIDEREAEMVASLLLRAAQRLGTPPPAVAPDAAPGGAAEVVARLQRSLGRPVGDLDG